MIVIREAKQYDADSIWEIIKDVISAGDTYAFAPDSSREQMLNYWLGPDRHTYVALINDEIAGTFVIRDNQPGLGSHIANGSYASAGRFRGQGVGRSMGEYSLVEARRLGYEGMQFNFVVKSNTHAVALWKKIGFEIIGEVPESFRHRTNGLTNTYIMYKRL